MITNTLPLIDKVALESYYTMIKSNPGLFTNEGLTTSFNDNISLFRPIEDEKINNTIKTLHELCDSARSDFDFVKEKSDELHNYKIEGKITNFRDYSICRKDVKDNHMDVSNMIILNLYAVDLFTGLSAKNVKYRIPVVFSLINHNGVPSVLLIKSSISLSHAYYTSMDDKDNKMYKIIPLSTTLLSDIAEYVINSCFNSSTDSLITISYNKIGSKYYNLTVDEYNKLLIKRVLVDNNIPTLIIDNWDDNKIQSIPVIDFSDDFSGSELEIESILCKNEYGMIEMTNYDEYKNNNDLAVILTTNDTSNLIINTNFDFHEDFTYTVNGRAYTIEDDKYVETEHGYDVELIVRAENENCVNRIGGLELIPFSEVAHSFDDTLLKKTADTVKDISTFVNNARKTTLNSLKNKKEAIDYMRVCNSKVDNAFKIFVSILSGVTTGALLGPAVGVLSSAMMLKTQVENKIDRNKAQKDISKLYNSHISFLDEKISEAKANDNTKLAIRFEKGKLAYENKIKKMNLAIAKEKNLKKIKSKYKKSNPYNK